MLFFLVLWPLVRLAMPFAPRSKNFGLRQAFHSSNSCGSFACAALPINLPQLLLTGRIFCRAHRLSRTRHLKEQAAFYLCGEFEEHSPCLLVSYRPASSPSSLPRRAPVLRHCSTRQKTHGS